VRWTNNSLSAGIGQVSRVLLKKGEIGGGKTGGVTSRVFEGGARVVGNLLDGVLPTRPCLGSP